MGLNDFRKGREAAAGSTSGGVGSLTAFIDQGSEFSGKLSFKDTVRIDGRFEGEIASENTLIVGETGQVHANIESEIVIVAGEIHGDISARGLINLHKNAKVFGNLRTGSLIVEDGAEINGSIEMAGKRAKGGAGAKKDPAKQKDENVIDMLVPKKVRED